MSRTPSGWPNGTQHGLLSGSFIPPRDQREVRELTRYRTSLVQERARAVNRLQKTLEETNIKLGDVATDILGESARAMLEGLLAGQSDAEQLAGLARGRLKAKRDELAGALVGTLQAHHRFLLQEHLDHIDQPDEAIGRVTREIGARLPPDDPPAERPPETEGAPSRLHARPMKPLPRCLRGGSHPIFRKTCGLVSSLALV